MIIVICLASFIIGFLLAVFLFLGYRAAVRKRKKVKHKGYSFIEKYKILKADNVLLHSDMEEHSVNHFR